MLLSKRLRNHNDLQSAARNAPPLMEGRTGMGVAVVQGLLADLGFKFDISFHNGKFDGIFGNETKRNVESFQRRSALKVDGIVGTMTLGKFDSLILDNNVLEEHNSIEADALEFRNSILPIHLRTRFTL